MLRESSTILDQWVTDVLQLTGSWWPRDRVWKSGPYKDESLGWLRDRLGEISEMRAVSAEYRVPGAASDMQPSPMLAAKRHQGSVSCASHSTSVTGSASAPRNTSCTPLDRALP